MTTGLVFSTVSPVGLAMPVSHSNHHFILTLQNILPALGPSCEVSILESLPPAYPY